MNHKLKALLPLLGNIAAALSSFLFSLLFLAIHSAEHYAVFSFVIVFGAVLQTLVNAVFVHPYASKSALRYGLDSKNTGPVLLLFLLLTTMLSYCCFQLLLADWQISLLIAIACLALTLRFYLRATLIQRGHFIEAYSGDLAFLVLTFLTASAAFYCAQLLWSYLLFCTGAIMACGWYWRQLRFRWRLQRSLRFCGLNFRRFGWHSLQAAIGAELLVTGISFVIIYGYGPTEYAPYALILLFMRPFTLVQNSLNQSIKFRLASQDPDVGRLHHRYWLINTLALLACSLIFILTSLSVPADSKLAVSNPYGLILLLTVLMLVRIGRGWFTIGLQATRQFDVLTSSGLLPALAGLLLMSALAFSQQPSVLTVIVLTLTEVFIVVRLFRRGKLCRKSSI